MLQNNGVFELAGKRVWVAGHGGMVGSAIVRRLATEHCEIITVSRASLDLQDQSATREWLREMRPDVVIVAAAKVGGILANDTNPVDFLYDNLMIGVNVIEASARAGVRKLLFLGSSCVYPRLAREPIKEDSLLTGPLEPTNESYAIAKIVGIKMCQALRRQLGCDFISAMPTNLYGPNDNFDLETAHVIPALLRKAHEAKVRGARHLVIWGTGTPRREFLHVDDCADACVHLVKTYSREEPINVGSGEDMSILELAELICGIVGFSGKIAHDLSKPDGMPRKRISTDKIRAVGWLPRIPLKDGLSSTYSWFRSAMAECRGGPVSRNTAAS